MDEPVDLSLGASVENVAYAKPGFELHPSMAQELLDQWQGEMEDSLPAGLRFMAVDTWLASDRVRRTMTVVSVH